MSLGVLASFVVGWLMDQVGLEVCTAVTLLLGQAQEIVLVWLADQRSFLVTSFVCYTLFRSFLFPVFIASLTTHLGYKYFGLLNGIGFALSGVAQAFMGHLVRAVQGDCHFQINVADVALAPPCDHGNWISLHVIELIILTALLAAPLLDYVEGRIRKHRLREALGSIRSLSFHLSNSERNHDYGSFASIPTSTDELIDEASVR